jgi:hypothetical protein
LRDFWDEIWDEICAAGSGAAEGGLSAACRSPLAAAQIQSGMLPRFAPCSMSMPASFLDQLPRINCSGSTALDQLHGLVAQATMGNVSRRFLETIPAIDFHHAIQIRAAV